MGSSFMKYFFTFLVMVSTLFGASATMSINDVSVTEGDSGTKNLTFTISMTAISASAVTFTYDTVNGTAVAGTDFTETNGTASIPAGSLSTTISVPIQGDLTAESDKYFYMNITSGALTVADSQGVGTILDDDTGRALSINDVSITEGDSGTQTVNLTVTMSKTAEIPITVSYSTGGGTATAGTDYTTASGSVTIAAGSTTATIPVTIKGDTTVEPNETFNVTIATSSGVPISDNVGVVTINDDDSRTIWVSDASASEGAGTMTFTVTMNSAYTSAVSVGYTTSNGTATAGSDYTTTTGTVVMPINSTSATFTVPILQDTTQEGDETFNVTISTATAGINISDNIGVGTIIDDDIVYEMWIGRDFSIREDDHDGWAAFYFGFTNPLPPGPVTVTYTTVDGTAKAGSDYIAKTGTVTLDSSNGWGALVDVKIINDTVIEPSETFQVKITSVSVPVVTKPVITITIIDDDHPIIDSNNTTIVEGNTGTKVATVPVCLNKISTEDVEIDYSIFEGNDQWAARRDDSDFSVSSMTGTVTIRAGKLCTLEAESLKVTVNGDLKWEWGERVGIWWQPRDASYVARDTYLEIQNDDGRLYIQDGSVVEGNSGGFSTNTSLRVVLDMSDSVTSSSTENIVVSYATHDGSATVGNDYQNASGSVTIPAGSTTVDIPLKIKGDTTEEPDENFYVQISNAQGVKFLSEFDGDYLHDDMGWMTILDDDRFLEAGHLWTSEGNSGQANGTFPIYLKKTSPEAMTVTCETMTNPYTTNQALAGEDYIATTKTWTIPAGQAAGTYYVNVPILGDVKYENDESFLLQCRDNKGHLWINDLGVGTIVNDDAPIFYYITYPPSISAISSATVAEGDVDYNLTLAVRLVNTNGGNSNFTSLPIDVNISYTIVGSTATPNVDYVDTNGTLTIKAGTNIQDFNITIKGDKQIEGDENFKIFLTSSQLDTWIAGGVPRNDLNVTIKDDDIVYLSVCSGEYNTTTNTCPFSLISIFDWEGSFGTSHDHMFSVYLNKAVDHDVAVTYHTTDGMSTTSTLNATVADNDYIGKSGVVVIPAGQRFTKIPVTIVGDNKLESNELFYVDINTTDPTITLSSYGWRAATIIVNDDNDSRQIFDRQREFTPRVAAQNVYGDLVATGGSVMCIDNGGSCNWNYGGSLITASTRYINDASMTLNSSSADMNLTLDTNTTIKWAGLYWQGHLAGNNPSNFDTDILGWNSVTFKAPDGTSMVVTADVNDTMQTNYYGFKTETTNTYPGYRLFYQASADVTNFVKAHYSPLTGRSFSVGNLKATNGADIVIGDPSTGDWSGLQYGHWGGWTLVIVYDRSDRDATKASYKNVSVFDGFKFLIASTTTPTKTIDINVSGFLTPWTLPIDSRLLYFGGGSEKAITGDTMQLRKKDGSYVTVSNTLNPANNVFNDSITFLGQHINSTRQYNPGIDLDMFDVSSLMSIKQDSTTIRLTATYTSQTDQALAGVVGFSTQIRQPTIDGFTKTSSSTGSSYCGTVQRIRPGDVITYRLDFSNTGTEAATDILMYDDFGTDVTKDILGTLVDNNVTLLKNSIRLSSKNDTSTWHCASGSTDPGCATLAKDANCSVKTDSNGIPTRVWCMIPQMEKADYYSMKFSIKVRSDYQEPVYNPSDTNLTVRNIAYAWYKNASTGLYVEKIGQSNVNTAGAICGSAPSLIGRADAWETLISDVSTGVAPAVGNRRIYTKISGQPFTLRTGVFETSGDAYKSFPTYPIGVRLVKNISPCDTTDQNITGWVDTNRTNAAAVDVNFSVANAYQDVKVQFAVKQNGVYLDTNRSCSSDDFAIRPVDIVIAPSSNQPLRAGSFFDMNATARNNALVQTWGYTNTPPLNIVIADATKACAVVDGNLTDSTGSFKHTSWSFTDGIGYLQNIRFNDIGDFNISITDTNWTAVDQGGDCLASNGTAVVDGSGKVGCLIGGSYTPMRIRPHHFGLNSTLTAGANGFTYISSDLAMATTLDMIVTAQSEQNLATRNYTTACYANPTSYVMKYNFPTSITPVGSLSKVVWKEITSDINSTTPIGDGNVTLNSVPKSVFATAGQAQLHFKLNFDRNETKLVNRFDNNISSISVNDIESNITITTAGSATYNTYSTPYLYGRINPLDVTQYDNNPATVALAGRSYIEVYNTSPITLNGVTMNKSLTGGDWWINAEHNQTSYGNAAVTRLVSGGSASTIAVSDSVYNNHGMTTHTLGTHNPPYRGVAHIKTQSWLWYDPNAILYNDPSDTSLDCRTHPCFNVEVRPTITNWVGGGVSGSNKNNKAQKSGTNESLGIDVIVPRVRQ